VYAGDDDHNQVGSGASDPPTHPTDDVGGLPVNGGAVAVSTA